MLVTGELIITGTAPWRLSAYEAEQLTKTLEGNIIFGWSDSRYMRRCTSAPACIFCGDVHV